MKVYLREISENGIRLDFETAPQQDSQLTKSNPKDSDWLLKVCQRLDEPETAPSDQPAKPVTKLVRALSKGRQKRPVTAEFSMRKVNDCFVLDGRVVTKLFLLCSRCANSFEFPIDHAYSTVFSLSPKAVESSTEGPRDHRDYDIEQEDGKDFEEADVTVLDRDFIDLSEVLNEQLCLQVPFQPLCREECLGMCQNCGTDLNRGRCACSKIVKESPFSILKNLKLGKAAKLKGEGNHGCS